MIGPTLDRPAWRVPIGLLGMLALVSAVEWTIAVRRLDFTTIWADDWRRTAQMASSKVKDRDVLCFGDSLVKFGVLPRRIEARAGLRAYNLALNAGTMPSAYFLLRRALESGAKPRAIVADFFTLMQPDRPRKSIRLYPDLATSRDCLDLAWTSGDPGFLSSTLLGKVLPSYKCRFEIRDSITAAMEGRRASPWPRLAPIWTAWSSEEGAQPMPPIPARPSVADPRLVSDISPDRWECDPIDAAYFEKFLALAKSRGVPVFWIMIPLCPEVQARRVRNGTDETYGRFARLAIGRHPEVVVLDARRSGYDDSVYVDAIHLDRRGASVLTDDLASILVERLERPGPAPRWVEMPPFAGRAGEIARSGEGETSRR